MKNHETVEKEFFRYLQQVGVTISSTEEVFEDIIPFIGDDKVKLKHNCSRRPSVKS